MEIKLERKEKLQEFSGVKLIRHAERSEMRGREKREVKSDSKFLD